MALLQMEKALYGDKIIIVPDLTEKSQQKTPENKSMIQLENTLLDMASTTDLCQGILYIFPVKVINKYIVR